MAFQYERFGGRPIAITQVHEGVAYNATIGNLVLPLLRLQRRRGKRNHIDYTNEDYTTQRLGRIVPYITAMGEFSPEKHPKAAEELSKLVDMEERDTPVRLAAVFSEGTSLSIPTSLDASSSGRIDFTGLQTRTKDLGIWDLDSVDLDEGDWFIGRSAKVTWKIKFVKEKPGGDS